MFHIPAYVYDYLKTSPISDLVDRFNHSVIPTILIFFTIMISTKQYVGSPIQCWLPKEFSGQWNQYAEDYCFIHETYYADIDNVGRITKEQKQANSAGYYQWVPVFLALSAAFFYLPMFVYQNIIKKKAGIDVQKWVEEAVKIKAEKQADIPKQLEPYTKDLAQQVLGGIHETNHLDAAFLYILLKVVFCVNLVAQIYHMNLFLGHESLWAFWSLFEMANGNDWTNRGYFPRVTFCDFRVRDLGATRTYSVQCVLMINMFNEKVYIFLWSLYVVMFVITMANLFYTIFNFYFPHRLNNYIEHMLKLSDQEKGLNLDSDPQRVQIFTQKLGKDALLALRLIEAHTDRRLCIQIIRLIYDQIQAIEEKKKEALKKKDEAKEKQGQKNQNLSSIDLKASFMNEDKASLHHVV